MGVAPAISIVNAIRITRQVRGINDGLRKRLMVKTMTHRENFLRKHDMVDQSYSLKKLSNVSGYSERTLQIVYNRGIGAYKTNPESVRIKGSFKKGPAPMSMKLSKEQWAMARVYSFLDGNPKHDADLR